MKTLLLLRHAKASTKDGSIEDHDRPLNARGKKEAFRMGELLVNEHLLPDLILSSDAKRCRRTAEKVTEAAGYRGETMLTNELYAAPPVAIVKQLTKLSEQLFRVLVVAHNPGLEELLEMLVESYEPLAPGALALVRLQELKQWRDFDSSTRGELVRVWQPKEVA